MKFKDIAVALLISLPSYSFCGTTLFVSKDKETPYTLTATYTNESESPKHLKLFHRKADYPTQIIRMQNNIENQQITCKDVHEQINKVLIDNITNNNFTYAFYVSCHYSPDNFLATDFSINSYFDPVNDEGIAYLNKYLSEFNGSTLLGTQLKIESAKGLIISLGIAAGMKKNPVKPPFTEYRKDRSNFYFKNNYEMKTVLFTDIYENFYTNNEAQILPFIDRWVFSNASALYKAVLRDSNYTELQPERIFIMDNGEPIFVSGLKQYFTHHCEKYANHRCLKPA